MIGTEESETFGSNTEAKEVADGMPQTTNRLELTTVDRPKIISNAVIINEHDPLISEQAHEILVNCH